MHIQTTSVFLCARELPPEHTLNRHVFKNISHHSPGRQKLMNGNKTIKFKQHGFSLFAHVY